MSKMTLQSFVDKPDDWLKWRVLSAVALSNLVEQFDRYLFSVSRLPFVDTTSYEYALLAGTFFSIVYCVGNIFWSVLNDYVELDRVTVVAMSCIASSTALVLIPFATTFAGQAGLRLFMGFSQSPITAFCSSLIKDAFKDEERGLAFGVFDSGTFLGFAISLTLGTVLYDTYGWKIPYLIMGVAGIAYAVVLRMTFHDPYLADHAEGEKRAVDGEGLRLVEDGSEASALVAVTRASTDDDLSGRGAAYSSHGSSISMKSEQRLPVTVPRSPPLASSNPLLHPETAADTLSVPLSRGLDVTAGGGDPSVEENEGHMSRSASVSTLSRSMVMSDRSGENRCASIYAWVCARLMRVVRFTRTYPSILIMLLGCGIRFCGGYQYAYYVSIFFGDTFEPQFRDGEEVDCKYSYDAHGDNGNDSCDDKDYPYCVDERCTKLADAPWHNEGMDHEDFEKYFAGMTVLGSVSSCLLGGWIGDYAATHWRLGTASRLVVAGASLVIAAPCYYGVYVLPYPACFGMIALGGFFGEMYYGLVLAVLAEMTPRKLYTIAVAMFVAVLVSCGSNGPVLVPLVRSHFADDDSLQHTFHLKVAPTYGEHKDGGTMDDVAVYKTTDGAFPLQNALCWLVCGCYIGGGVILLLSVRFVARDLERIRQDKSDQNIANC